MKKQSGYTWAGLALSGGLIAFVCLIIFYIYPLQLQRSRDDQRIKDLEIIRTTILEHIKTTGRPPETAAMVDLAATAANSYQRIRDPREGEALCLNSMPTLPLVECTYTYRLCDKGNGFVLGARFESKSRLGMYMTDTVNATGEGSFDDAAMFEIGECMIYDDPIPVKINARGSNPLVM